MLYSNRNDVLAEPFLLIFNQKIESLLDYNSIIEKKALMAMIQRNF